ncbi:hypothetical protein CEE69_17035 [Rhodopirellula bahusiensis]|uniref:Uncharacterized protein n=1 Tax=Rhodopirellula bahusiensis TaxID=2014065 RepID=A0A2G1W5T8_9BACT|nr:hypothetical protein CEE69_17035 [Rhodopirellula bahusiensis]
MPAPTTRHRVVKMQIVRRDCEYLPKFIGTGNQYATGPNRHRLNQSSGSRFNVQQCEPGQFRSSILNQQLSMSFDDAHAVPFSAHPRF